MKNNSTVQVSAIFALIILLAIMLTSCTSTEKVVILKYSTENETSYTYKVNRFKQGVVDYIVVNVPYAPGDTVFATFYK